MRHPVVRLTRREKGDEKEIRAQVVCLTAWEAETTYRFHERERKLSYFSSLLGPFAQELVNRLGISLFSREKQLKSSVCHTPNFP